MVKDKKNVLLAIGKNNTSYATGKRKTSIARVWLWPGSGKFVINKQSADQYFSATSCFAKFVRPLVVTKTMGQYDVYCTVQGGGVSGQVGAILHGIAKALNKSCPDYHSALKRAGFLTRDARVVERKKYGLRKARKRPQFSKR
ncbi:30S ribosomal protein S9 [Rickettsiales endosymbiont of Paramecium tredecaurelia]|uniref:30S ribosomal protein S9 n=1 Tax=Candidatus Sarmatiella mevalonica TaxID=2770581 RepID=UPI001923F17F|nr:30S ribosomal protein S9 [Candidatus Sarmatiella mevalonica]MBL3284929.1 30S ribosomal protein S9 [Candidatus Sarmatiella mevalonica]